MSRRAFTLLTVFLLLSPSLASAQGIEVQFFAKYTDEPIETVLTLLKVMGDFEVEVDPSLKDRTVTVEFKGETPRAALALLARAMKVELVTVSANRYRLAPRGSAKPGADRENPRVEPEWGKAIRKRLLETKVAGVYRRADLSAVLRDLAKASGVAIYLDVPVSKERTPGQMKVTSTPDPGPASASDVLRMALEQTKLEFDVRWRGVLVSTPERIRELRARRLLAAGEATEAQAPLRKKLRTKKINVSLKGSSIASALGRIARLGGVRIRYEETDLRSLPAVDLKVKKMPLEGVLGFVLVPRGLEIRVEEDALVVQPAKRE
jgi:type II secretory pathway component GspD/PulD (secretin)